jgi:hypothetical protein
MRFDLASSPYAGNAAGLPGAIFDVGTPASSDCLTVRVILPVEHRDGRWTLYATVDVP